MSFFYLFFCGILIGAGMIIPGVSGGIIAVILGVYDKAIESINNLFKKFKESFIYLFILMLGVLIGAVWFSNVLIFLYNKHEVITRFCFIGLILGGIPFLYRQIKIKGYKFNKLLFVITFLFSFCIWLFSNEKIIFNLNNEINIFNLFLAGIIYSVGKVVPGISGSFLLIVIGMYEFVLNVIAHPITYGFDNLKSLVPFIIGFIIGVMLLIKLMNYLLKNHFGIIYSIIIGFVMGSIFSLLPNNLYEYNIFYSIFCMILCFGLSYKLTK